MKKWILQQVHNIAEKLYYKYIDAHDFLWRGHIMPIAHYIIFPEFRKKEYHVRRKIKYVFDVLFVLVFISMTITVGVFDGKLSVKSFEFWKARQTIDSLRYNAQRIVYENVKDSFLVSGSYLRYELYKDMNIEIPNKMSDEHLAFAVKEAKENGVPLKLLFRVIKKESDFDSVVINSSSGAFGFMQTVGQTFNGYYEQLGLKGGKTVKNNIIVGIHRLRDGYDYWKHKRTSEQERWSMAVACYVIGDSLPRSINGIPDTVKPYVNFVMNPNN